MSVLSMGFAQTIDASVSQALLELIAAANSSDAKIAVRTMEFAASASAIAIQGLRGRLAQLRSLVQVTAATEASA